MDMSDERWRWMYESVYEYVHSSYQYQERTVPVGVAVSGRGG